MAELDLAFTFTNADPKMTHFLFLIKAIAVFNVNPREQTVLPVQELAARMLVRTRRRLHKHLHKLSNLGGEYQIYMGLAETTRSVKNMVEYQSPQNSYKYNSLLIQLGRIMYPCYVGSVASLPQTMATAVECTPDQEV